VRDVALGSGRKPRRNPQANGAQKGWALLSAMPTGGASRLRPRRKRPDSGLAREDFPTSGGYKTLGLASGRGLQRQSAWWRLCTRDPQEDARGAAPRMKDHTSHDGMCQAP